MPFDEVGFMKVTNDIETDLKTALDFMKRNAQFNDPLLAVHVFQAGFNEIRRMRWEMSKNTDPLAALGIISRLHPDNPQQQTLKKKPRNPK